MAQQPGARSLVTCIKRLYCTCELKNMATAPASAWFFQPFIGEESKRYMSPHRQLTLKAPQLIRRSQMKTSKSGVFFRSCFVVFFVFLPLSWAWNAATGTIFWKPWEMAISAIFTVAFFGSLAWLITNVGMGLLFGGKPEYRAYRNSGGDPFFDSLPRIFNPDSQTVRQSGTVEPETNFHPPASWQFRCPRCNARVQHRVDVCWNCSYGQDSDSTAYFERHGHVKPPEISDAEWDDLRRRHDV